jgi:hypothetical protein
MGWWRGRVSKSAAEKCACVRPPTWTRQLSVHRLSVERERARHARVRVVVVAVAAAAAAAAVAARPGASAQCSSHQQDSRRPAALQAAAPAEGTETRQVGTMGCPAAVPPLSRPHVKRRCVGAGRCGRIATHGPAVHSSLRARRAAGRRGGADIPPPAAAAWGRRQRAPSHCPSPPRTRQRHGPVRRPLRLHRGRQANIT